MSEFREIYCPYATNWQSFNMDDVSTYPQCGKIVLLCTNNCVISVGKREDGVWRDLSDGAIYGDREITHWAKMPLPPMEWLMQCCAVGGEP